METNKSFKPAYVVYGIFFLLLFLNTCNSCNTKTRATNIEKDISILEKQIDSLNNKLTKMPQMINFIVEVEGLKAEHRAIEACDRTMFDRNRQNIITEDLKRFNPLLQESLNNFK
jgi:hypothetical protein